MAGEASQVALMVKNPPANAGDGRDTGSIPGSGRSPGGGHATHCSILAWRIPWTEEPGRLQSMGLHRVGHDWSDLAHMPWCRVAVLGGGQWKEGTVGLREETDLKGLECERGGWVLGWRWKCEWMQLITSALGKFTVSLLLLQCRAGQGMRGGASFSLTLENLSGEIYKGLQRGAGGLCLRDAPSQEVC